MHSNSIACLFLGMLASAIFGWGHIPIFVNGVLIVSKTFRP